MLFSLNGEQMLILSQMNSNIKVKDFYAFLKNPKSENNSENKNLKKDWSIAEEKAKNIALKNNLTLTSVNGTVLI